jgi:hypothetical protein
MNRDKRPDVNDRVVVRRAADAVLGDVLRWCGAKTGCAVAREIARELWAAVEESAPGYDAYEIARNLESECGWNPNVKLVEALVGAAQAAMKTFYRYEEVWVRRYKIRPKHHVGVVVAATLKENVVVQGEIISIEQKRGYYCINSPQLGHVAEGEAGVHGILVPYERVTMALRQEESCGNTPA